MMSAGSRSRDWPMPYQLCSLPPRPWRPNSGYSCGKTGGSGVQKEWPTCRRCVVSEVRGRKSGRTYSTPIDLLELNGKRYLVAPRGRNAMGAQRGSRRRGHAEEGKNAAEIRVESAG